MCTRYVYNGIDTIVGFNFDIDLSVWDHTVITEENRFYIGIKMPDGLYHSFHGINKNGNVGTLLYVHGNENARYIESEDCITISELTEKFIKAEISFDKALDIVKKKKIIYAPDATMQAMLSDKKGRVLIIEPGIGYRYEQENFSLITNYSILKPDITKPYIVSGDTRYEVAKELLAGYDKDFSVNDAFKVLKSVSQKDLWATRVSFVYSTEKNKVYYVLNNDFSNVFEFQFLPEWIYKFAIMIRKVIMIGLKKRDIKKAWKAGGVSLADVRADNEATIDEAMNSTAPEV